MQDSPVRHELMARLMTQPFNPAQLARAADPNMLTKEMPRPDMRPQPAEPSRSKLYRAGELASFVGNGLDLATTLDFLHHGHTEANPLFGARPNPAVLALTKGGMHLFNKWLMRKMANDGMETAAGIYGIGASVLPFKAGWQNLTGF